MASFDRALAGLIDHTLLAPASTRADVERVCRETRRYRFAAVVVPPFYVPLACIEMKNAGIPVCTVVSFPFGWDPPDVKCAQAGRAIDMGAEEVDMVMNVPEFLSGNIQAVEREVSLVADVCRGKALLKLIIETAYLSEDQIAEAARAGAGSGADVIKTSTGFSPRGATIEDVSIIRGAVDPHTGVKAAGGIRTHEQARALVDAGATRIGCSASLDVIRLG